MSNFEFSNNACPYYLNELYEYALTGNIESRSNFAKLKAHFCKTNMEQKALSYIGPSLWTNLSKSMKKKTILNTFNQHNLKKQYLGNLVGS